MWTAIAATCVTSSMFLTALAPNLLAAELVRKAVGVDLSWMQWFLAFAPVGVVLLLAVPLLTYGPLSARGEAGRGSAVWAAQEIHNSGTYALPEEHAVLLTGDGHTNTAPTSRMINHFGSHLQRLASCMRDGGGIPYFAYRPRVHAMHG